MMIIFVGHNIYLSIVFWLRNSSSKLFLYFVFYLGKIRKKQFFCATYTTVFIFFLFMLIVFVDRMHGTIIIMLHSNNNIFIYVDTQWCDIIYLYEMYSSTLDECSNSVTNVCIHITITWKSDEAKGRRRKKNPTKMMTQVECIPLL